MFCTFLLSAILTIAPSDGLRDRAVTIAAHTAPDRALEFVLHLRDANGVAWTSRVVAATDARGEAKLAEPRRLFSSALPSVGTAPFAWPRDLQPATGRLELVENGRVVAQQPLVRRQIGANVMRQRIATSRVYGESFIPRNGTSLPAVVVLGGSEGGYPIDIPAMLASHRIAALSSAYFGEPGLPQDLVEVPIERVRDAVHYLAALSRVNPRRIAVLGVSRGGELAFVAAAHFPEIRAAAGIVPSPIVEAGLRFGKSPVNESAWTLQGKPLPFASYAQIMEFIRSGNAASVPNAVIDFQRINGPVAIIAGADDRLGLSGLLFRRTLNLLHLRAGDLFEDYRGAGHLIEIPYTPTANRETLKTPYGMLQFGGNPDAYAAADAQSWPLLVHFLYAH